ncbi:hypothetical protein T484DRAFT_1916252, partial [Baffinella frigidus]
MAGTGELEGGELGGASTFERLLRKHDIAHDFSPSVSPQQAKEIRNARRELFANQDGGVETWQLQPTPRELGPRDAHSSSRSALSAAALELASDQDSAGVLDDAISEARRVLHIHAIDPAAARRPWELPLTRAPPPLPLPREHPGRSPPQASLPRDSAAHKAMDYPTQGAGQAATSGRSTGLDPAPRQAWEEEAGAALHGRAPPSWGAGWEEGARAAGPRGAGWEAVEAAGALPVTGERRASGASRRGDGSAARSRPGGVGAVPNNTSAAVQAAEALLEAMG